MNVTGGFFVCLNIADTVHCQVMAKDGVLLSFDGVTFEYGPNKPILIDVSFSVRQGMKVALMGQNGAGKSTIFGLLTGAFTPEEGDVHIVNGVTIATARQVIPRAERELTIRDFFLKCFKQKVYDIDPRIDEVLEVVNLHAPHDRIVQSFSGGQQARLLLASALIQDPDLLLLDEPTNNLDAAGIDHLTKFLVNYKKTCIVISHDAQFLNAFTQGVLYLDIFTNKVEQYAGNYFDVVAEISARIEKENTKNALLSKQIQEKKDKANFFAHKGGNLRLVAKRMRDLAEEMEEEKVDVRREDRTIRPFTIPSQEDFSGERIAITSYTTLNPKSHKPINNSAKISLSRNRHLLLRGPNGIGKTTLLEAIATGAAKGVKIAPDIRVGYYRQDFSTLNFEDSVHDSLMAVMDRKIEEDMRKVAAGFLITADVMHTKIGSLSEGQKGLVAFARLVLERPGLLILDEPTNHINFRHLPVIAEALGKYQGAMILVSHVPEFVEKVRIDETLDLGK